MNARITHKAESVNAPRDFAARSQLHSKRAFALRARGAAWRFVLGALVALGGATVLAQSDQPAFRVVLPDEKVDGKSYGQWQAQWWQWVLATPWNSHHPLRDRTGADALRGQSGPVWFLGAGMVTSPPSSPRDLVVPVGQRLYVAIGNVECSTLDDCPFCGTTEAQLRACAESWHIQEPVLEIDGLPVPDLERFQVTSPLFSFTAANPNMFGVSSGVPGEAVSSGVGVILEPLAPGPHTLYFHSTYAEDPATSLAQMTYEITVVEPPTLTIRALPGTDRVEISWPETAGYSLYQADTCAPSAAWAAAAVESSRLENGVRIVIPVPGPTQRYYRLALR